MCLKLQQNGGNSWGCTVEPCRWREHVFFSVPAPFMCLNTNLLLVFYFPHLCVFSFSCQIFCTHISSFSTLCLSISVAVSSISSGIREEWRGGVWRIVRQSLPGSHAFVIKLLILCCAPFCASASDFCFFLWPTFNCQPSSPSPLHSLSD